MAATVLPRRSSANRSFAKAARSIVSANRPRASLTVSRCASGQAEGPPPFRSPDLRGESLRDALRVRCMDSPFCRILLFCTKRIGRPLPGVELPGRTTMQLPSRPTPELSAEQFRALGYRVVDMVADHLGRLGARLDPARRPEPATSC